MRQLQQCYQMMGVHCFPTQTLLKQPRRAVGDSFTVKTSLGGRPTRRCMSTTPAAESKLLFGTPQLSLAAYGVKSPFYYYKYTLVCVYI